MFTDDKPVVATCTGNKLLVGIIIVAGLVEVISEMRQRKDGTTLTIALEKTNKERERERERERISRLNQVDRRRSD